MDPTSVRSLPMAIGLNLLFPGLGYLYMGKWLVGITGGVLILGIYATTGLLFLLPAWIGLNLIMAIDMVILSNKNKSRVLSETTIKCPNCAELIQREANVCRFCSYQLADSQSAAVSLITPGLAGPATVQPALAAPASDEKPSGGNSAWAVSAVLVVAALALLMVNQEKASRTVARESEPQSPAPTASQLAMNPGYAIGDLAKTKYFDITLNKVWIVRRINPNEFVDIVANEGERFVVLEATIKNTDTEGRMFAPGKLQANVGGRTLSFDVTETVLSDEYTLLENLNPLTTIRKRIAFRIPTEAVANLTWTPGRTDVQIALAEKPSTRATTAPAPIDPKQEQPSAALATSSAQLPAQVVKSAEKLEKSAPDAWKPSFDCVKATTEAERLICSSKELSESDVAVSQLYSRALSLASDKSALRQEQSTWLKTRRDACANADCMLKAYVERIAQLSR